MPVILAIINNRGQLALKRASITTSLSSYVNIKESDILNAPKSRDVNARGHDDISIRILKCPVNQF